MFLFIHNYYKCVIRVLRLLVTFNVSVAINVIMVPNLSWWGSLNHWYSNHNDHNTRHEINIKTIYRNGFSRTEILHTISIIWVHFLQTTKNTHLRELSCGELVQLSWFYVPELTKKVLTCKSVCHLENFKGWEDSSALPQQFWGGGGTLCIQHKKNIVKIANAIPAF